MGRPRKDAEPQAVKRPPATTPQARENQLISLAVDAAEKQLKDGTASSQVITHFLKLATVRESMEREKIQLENELLKARTESIASAKHIEELYAEALKAMTAYRGEGEIDDYT